MDNEYQQVAALLCMDVKSWYKTAQAHPESALECFKELNDVCKRLQTDKEWRESRYAATAAIFSLPNTTENTGKQTR